MVLLHLDRLYLPRLQIREVCGLLTELLLVLTCSWVEVLPTKSHEVLEAMKLDYIHTSPSLLVSSSYSSPEMSGEGTSMGRAGT